MRRGRRAGISGVRAAPVLVAWAVFTAILASTIGCGHTTVVRRTHSALVSHLPRTRPSPIGALFDNRAVSRDDDPGAADFDGSGNSLSATDLDNAGWSPGAPVTVNGTAYVWPAVSPGQPDNVVAAGQTLSVSGKGNALGFLAAATHGPAGGRGTVRYTDGTTSGYSLTVDDWASPDTTTSAVTLPHPHGRRAFTASLRAVTVPISESKRVAAVTLPSAVAGGAAPAPALHVFDVRVREAARAPDGRFWTGSWATSFGSAPTAPQLPGWRDQTLRMVVHPHLGGTMLRLRFANTFSPAPVRLGRVTVAVQATRGTARAVPAPVTFLGGRQVILPAGGETSSDPVSLQVPEGRNVLVSVYLPGQVTTAPVHSYALTTSYATSRGGGDHTADRGAGSFPGTFSFWTCLSGVDMATTNDPGTVVALGDSQTDGGHTAKDADHRWPDDYADILLRRGTGAPVILNAGISGNRLLLDRDDRSGVAAVNRLDRDVFAQPNVRALILYEGINDIALDHAGATTLEDGIRRIAAQAHARGLRIIAATIPAFGDYRHHTPAAEAVRRDVNAYIRTTGDLDQYVDFDLATRDPATSTRLREGCYDPADGLHFNDTGTRLLAAALAALRP